MALGTTGLVTVAALTAGAVGAGAAVLFAPAPHAPPPAPSPDAALLASLEERIAKQEQQIRLLQGRVEEAAHAASVAVSVSPRQAFPSKGDGAGGSPGAGDGAAGASGHVPNPASVEAGDSADRTEQLARFETLYKAMREKEQEDGRKARLAAFEVQLRERIDRAQGLNLAADQKEQVVKLLLARSEKVRGIFEEARASGTADAIQGAQEKATAARQEARQSLEALLTPEQMKVLDTVDREGGGNRPGGRVPGPDGGRRNAAGGRRGNPPAGGQDAPK